MYARLEPETPFLAVDVPTLERNIARMADAIIRDGRKNWRPHVKAVKTPAIAHKLLAAGAIGVTCAKVSEAEVMAAAGITNILVANQVVGPGKTQLLACLNRDACVMAAVDARDQVTALDEAAKAAGTQVPLLIEVEIGLKRAGVTAGEAVVELARFIQAHANLRFLGLMGWEGHATKIADPKEKETVIRAAVGLLTDSAKACERAGIPVQIVSCGGTGTYPVTSRIDGVTEIQAGGGIFGDVRYRTEFNIDHEYALTVWTTVISRPNPRRIVCDAGWKAIGRYPTLPLPVGVGRARDIVMSAEHTVVELDTESDTPRIGDRLQFVVGYSDSTVFLHDRLYAMRDGAVELAWPLLARGKIW